MAARNRPLIEWDDALTLGDETIDRQHKRLVELINQMDDNRDAPDREMQVMRCITCMYLHAKEHFWDEEAFMARVGYPDRDRHAELHRQFVRRTHELTDCCLTDDAPYIELLDFLVAWFKDHVATEDLRLVAFAKGRDAC
ncbi:MAG: bacteriohemerythrin [Humidesulfovibrio sp.]